MPTLGGASVGYVSVAVFDLLRDWPGEVRGVITLGEEGANSVGDCDAVLEWASLSKVAVAFVALRCVADGVIGLDDAVGPPGVSVRHLLSHASGFGPDTGHLVASPGKRRIYSNFGFEVLAAHLARWSGSEIATLLADELFGPLGMTTTSLEGSPAHGVTGSTNDLARFLAELRQPSLLEPPRLAEMFSVQFGGLPGVLPGLGRFDPCDWGLGVEVKGTKAPHWTPRAFGPTSIGHFGRSGGFLLFDPVRDLGVCTLGDTPFGPWALAAWPAFLSALAAEHT